MKRAGIACFVVGAVLAAFFVVLIVRNAPSTPQPIGDGLVRLSKEGLTLWASEPDLTATCEVKAAGDVDVPLVADGSETIGINGVEWYLVARSAEPVPPGEYVVSCIADDTDATFAAGPRSSILTFVLAILGVVFSLLIFIALGAILLAVGARRRRKNKPGNTFPGGYPQPGGPQYGPGPQEGNAFPGYPPPGTYNPGPNPDRPQDRPQDS
jgi:hypothetical protein